MDMTTRGWYTFYVRVVRIPVPDQGFDIQRTELCIHTTGSSWKKLPRAAELVFAAASFCSMVKSYLGRALVLRKTTVTVSGVVIGLGEGGVSVHDL